MQISPYLAAIIAAWVVAQGGKFVLSMLANRGRADFRQLYASGNMPSSHSATVTALVTVVGLHDGGDGPLFGIAVLFAAIVMYDAIMVRRSAGEQGAAIHALIKEQKSNVKLPRAAKGHEPLEVIIGAIVGLIVGAIVYFVMFH